MMRVKKITNTFCCFFYLFVIDSPLLGLEFSESLFYSKCSISIVPTIEYFDNGSTEVLSYELSGEFNVLSEWESQYLGIKLYDPNSGVLLETFIDAKFDEDKKITFSGVKISAEVIRNVSIFISDGKTKYSLTEELFLREYIGITKK